MQNQLPPFPLDYSSSLIVRTGISLAYSTLYNPRQLESPWYTPYGSTFAEIAEAFCGHLLVHPQYTVTIPHDDAKLMKLKQEFLDLGLDFDNPETIDTVNPPEGWLAEILPTNSERATINRTGAQVERVAQWASLVVSLKDRRVHLYADDLKRIERMYFFL